VKHVEITWEATHVLTTRHRLEEPCPSDPPSVVAAADSAGPADLARRAFAARVGSRILRQPTRPAHPSSPAAARDRPTGVPGGLRAGRRC